MRKERGPRTFLLRRVPGSAWLTVATLAVIGLVVTWWLVDGEPGSTVPTDDQGASEVSTTDIASDDAPPEIPLTGQSQVVDAPTPEAVLADPQCRMVVGQRTASDTALVYLPLGEGAWFALVNTLGVVFDGTLPFEPDRHAFGKRPDGTAIAGFGRDGKVQVFHDGQLVYKLDNAWDFDVAANGSTFYAIEPLTGAARLVVRNIDLGEEHHYELDDSLVPSGSKRNFGTSYSTDFSEIIVSSLRGGWMSPGTPAARSAADMGIVFNLAPMASAGVQRFFRVDGEPVRAVTLETARRGMFFPPESAIFASSETGYDVRFENGVGWRIAKVAREYGRDGRVSRVAEVWSRQVSLSDSTPLLPPVLSRDGAWLGVWGAEFQVLNTTTGEPAASLSQEEEGDEGLGVEFRGNQLLGYRREGKSVAVYAVDLNSTGDDPNRVVGRLRHDPDVPGAVGGILNDYWLEFDWDRTPGPSRRLAVCSEDVPLLGALRVRDDRLTFEAGSETRFR